MRKLKIIINKPVKEVYEFTTNPKNTPLWISSIKEEIAEYPPKIGTVYKNRGDAWQYYKVVELEQDQVFTLSDGNYHVRYTYRKLSESQTELEYCEWMEDGELEHPFTEDVLKKLKSVMEK